MASKCIEYSYPYLLVLAETIDNPQIRRHLLKNKQVLKALTELTWNILKQNFEIQKKDKIKLKQFHRGLIYLATGRSWKQKEQLFSGHRGGQLLSTILGVGLPILANLLFSRHHGSHSE
jgi:hypothetical protein